MPTTLEALAILLTFSVPAYLTIAVYRARNPVRYYREKQSPIEQAALYLFLGTVVNIVTVFTLWLLVVAFANLFPMTSSPLSDISGDPAGELFMGAFLLLVAYLATGTVISLLVGNVIAYFLREEPPLWWKELGMLGARRVRTGLAPWVLAHLKNGDRCLGLLGEVRWIGDEDNTMELTLEKSFYELTGSRKRERVGRVLLRTEDILWLSPYSD